MLASQSSGFGFSEDMLDMDCLREIHCKIADLNSEKDLYIVTRTIDLFRWFSKETKETRTVFQRQFLVSRLLMQNVLMLNSGQS